MELNQEQLSKLDELVTLITLSKDGAIAFLLCNEPVLRKELYNELEKRLETLNIKIINIQLDEKSSDLVNEIREKVPSTRNITAIFVYGIERASKALTSSGKSAFLTKLNIMREEFSNINQPVIIWSNEATITRIANEAPDFWSWRTTVFEFRMQKTTEPVERTERITESGLENLTIDELNERYKQYSELLEEYKNKNIVDDHKFADWYLKLGLIHYFRGEYDEALEKYRQSMEIWRKLGYQQGMATTLHNIAYIHQDKGEYDEALEKYKQSMEIKEKLGYMRGIATTLHSIAIIHQDKGEYDEAFEKYRQSMDIDIKLGDQRGIAYTLAQIGSLYFHKGKKEEAIESTQKALDIFEKIGLKNEAQKAKYQIKKMST
jgi:G-protein signaling modulator 2